MDISSFAPTNIKTRKLVQQLANLQGLNIPVDGKWDDVTKRAVQMLQDKNKMNFSKTKIPGCPQLSNLVVELNKSSGNKYKDVIKTIQKRLKDMGYPVTNSGTFDKKTELAICQLQENIGKKVTGAIAPYVDDTWHALLDGKAINIPENKYYKIELEEINNHSTKTFVRKIVKDKRVVTNKNKVDIWINTNQPQNISANPPAEAFSPPAPPEVENREVASRPDIINLQDSGSIDSYGASSTTKRFMEAVAIRHAERSSAQRPKEDVTHLVLHHTAGGKVIGSIEWLAARYINESFYGSWQSNQDAKYRNLVSKLSRTMNKWKNNGLTAGTNTFVHYWIGRDGTIYQTMDEDMWANHCGSTSMAKKSISIQLANMGYNCKSYSKADKSKKIRYKNSPNENSRRKKVTLGGEWRGHKLYEAYYTEQIDSLISLVNYIRDKYTNIKNIIPDGTNFYPTTAIAKDQNFIVNDYGILCHTHFSSSESKEGLHPHIAAYEEDFNTAGWEFR